MCATFVRTNTPNVCVFVRLVIIKIIGSRCRAKVVRLTRARQRTRVALVCELSPETTDGPRRRRRAATIRPSRCGRRRKRPSTASVSPHFISHRARRAFYLVLSERERCARGSARSPLTSELSNSRRGSGRRGPARLPAAGPRGAA